MTPTLVVLIFSPHAFFVVVFFFVSYVPSLERIVVLRLLAQLSSVYHTVTLERLQVWTALSLAGCSSRAFFCGFSS